MAPDGAIYHLYSLTRSDPLAPATTSTPNRLDNVEVIAAAPLAGEWRIEVTAATMGEGESQPYSLVVTGLAE